MKRIHTGLIIAVVLSIFLVSFLIGRATVLRDTEGENNAENNIYTEMPDIHATEEKESVEASQKTENVADTSRNEEKKESTDVSAPQRMSFPAGTDVRKGYSQTAVYSETMGDWRAHTGIDYAAALGEGVLCAYEGQVTAIYKDKLWGYTVEITHSGNVKSVYKNLDEKISVQMGQTVKEGQAVGAVGKSADIECLEPPHLHFEIWQDGVAINPESYVY